MRKENFTTGEYYHIYNRTLLNIPEFKSHNNCFRLTQAFLLSNSTKSTQAFQFLRNHKDATLDDALKIAQSGEKLVDVLCYAIMPDHYHLLIRELKEKGITEFIRKCNISIAKYINTSKDRRGPVFESRFKSKHIKANDYLIHLSLYIHLNPLDFIAGKNWREHKLTNWSRFRKRLVDYKWSSLGGFLNINKNDIISGAEIILSQFENQNDYESYLKNWSEDSLLGLEDTALDHQTTYDVV